MQVHEIDVEQGDAVLIISPEGQTAMVDNGNWMSCGNTVSYVKGLGVERLDYHFATHYDADHIGCLDDLVSSGVSVMVCYDRGGWRDTATARSYFEACDGKRRTALKGEVVTLDVGSAEVVSIKVVDLAGAGVRTSEENALSMVLKVSYGSFDHVFGGDLPAESPDVESIVGPEVGDVEVYKVHHHGSKSSSGDAWLEAVTPEVGIVSVGENRYGHPTLEALARLRARGVKTYWTNAGSGAQPDGAWDRVVGGSIVIEAGPRLGEVFTVSGPGFRDEYWNR